MLSREEVEALLDLISSYIENKKIISYYVKKVLAKPLKVRILERFIELFVVGFLVNVLSNLLLRARIKTTNDFERTGMINRLECHFECL